jgi:hypothetical protein
VPLAILGQVFLSLPFVWLSILFSIHGPKLRDTKLGYKAKKEIMLCCKWLIINGGRCGGIGRRARLKIALFTISPPHSPSLTTAMNTLILLAEMHFQRFRLMPAQVSKMEATLAQILAQTGKRFTSEKSLVRLESRIYFHIDFGLIFMHCS